MAGKEDVDTAPTNGGGLAAISPVDVVVVAFNSREHLRSCVEHLSALDGVHVVVVDSASTDESLETLDGLAVECIRLSENRGFAHGCNIGWRAGKAPFVLFLNPDAKIDRHSLRILTRLIQDDQRVAMVAPRIVNSDGTLDWSQRRFPRLTSTYAQALFLHRLFPRAPWTDEVIRDKHVYERPGSPEWVSGACMLVRRTALEQVCGLDEGFFLYCEDTDLCRRLGDAGYRVWFEPRATCVHTGGGSGNRSDLLPVAAASRRRYAEKYRSGLGAALERAGIALGALTHLLGSTKGRRARAGHARALGDALFRRSAP